MNRSDRTTPHDSARVVALPAGALAHAAAIRANPCIGHAHPGSRPGNNVTVMRPATAVAPPTALCRAAPAASAASASNRVRNTSALIRSAATTDADALAGLIREPMVAMHDDRADLVHRRDAVVIALTELHDPRIDTLVAEAAEGLQGFLQLRWGMRPPSAGWRQGSVELRRHLVRARHRGAGVAMRLLEDALDLARLRGAECMWLKVDKGSLHAVGFYRKHGFRIAGTALSGEDGARREHWVMHRGLA